MKLYRDFTTQEEIDAHYNVLGNVADPDAMIAAWAERSDAAVARLDCRLDVRYGPTLAEYCDVFPAGPGAPVHVFIHGGYWRRFSARDHDFVVPQLVAAGLTTVVVNYALCPIVTPRRDRPPGPRRDRLDVPPCGRVRRRSRRT